MKEQSYQSAKEIAVLKTKMETKIEYIEKMNKITLSVSGINLIGILFLILRVLTGI